MSNFFKYCLSLLILCSCNDKNGTQLFTVLDERATGLDFSNSLKESSYFNILEYLYYYNGGGVALGDIDNDGLTDIYLVSNSGQNRLFINKGNLQFEDITETAGIGEKGYWSTGASMADVNGDGFLDIYVCEVGEYKIAKGRNRLFINNGDLTFEEKAVEYGLDFKGFSTQSAFFDYDKDGDLDMFLLNHAVHTRRSYGDTSLRYERAIMAGDRLFRHDRINGRSFFSDVTDSSGIFRSLIGYGLGVSIADINSDSWPDIYVSNDFHEDDYLYINNKNGTFSENLKSRIQHTSRFSMGNDIADINNDGLPDIMELDMLPAKESILKKSAGEETNDVNDIKLSFGYHHQLARNTLQLNLGNGLFSEIALLSDLYATDWSWTPLIADYDNDGLKDIFISNGIFKRPNDLDYINFMSNAGQQLYATTTRDSAANELIARMPTERINNYFFRNEGGLEFSDRSKEWGMNQPGFTTSAAYGDLDNDGDLDIVVNNLNSKAQIYRNNGKNNYLKVSFSGPEGNTKGIGTSVQLINDGESQYQSLYPVKGYLSGVDFKLVFGLDSTAVVDTVIVKWPNNKIQILTEVNSNQHLVLKESNAENYTQTDEQLESVFTDRTPGTRLPEHQEDDFKDYDEEYLIPHKLSTQGPKLSVGDINNDGLDDFYVCGALNQEGKLFIQTRESGFEYSLQEVFKQDSAYEDVDSHYFDADSDGDLDLYVVSGGNRFQEGSELLQDRLYINDGRGNFSRSNSVPSLRLNGSCAASSDFDGDGDIDLFVGSRNVPGQYGVFPNSILLENDGDANFTDVTDELAPVLAGLGMVSDGEWSDYDNDGDDDLIIIGEWMPITILANDKGNFTNATSQLGLSETNGWWNTLKLTDIDRDGDPDFLIGNLGLNSKIKASKEQPVTLYVHDFDDNGSLDPILCHYKEGYSTPFPTVLDLTRQITSLRKRFRTFSEYAEVKTIDDIFSKQELDGAVIRKAYNFETSWIENRQEEGMVVHPLPLEAQFAPVFSFEVLDFDHDENLDILLGGNFYGASINYGRYDASYGWLLSGSGEKVFKTVDPSKSGVKIRGEIRDIKLVRGNDGKPLVFFALNDGPMKVLELNSGETSFNFKD